MLHMVSMQRQIFTNFLNTRGIKKQAQLLIMPLLFCEYGFPFCLFEKLLLSVVFIS